MFPYATMTVRRPGGARAAAAMLATLAALLCRVPVHAQAPSSAAAAPAASAAPRGAREAADPGAPSPAAAQGRWKWRDASGRINISDLPPPREIPEKDILERRVPAAAPRAGNQPPATAPTPARAASAPGGPRSSSDPELERRRRASLAREAQAQPAAEDPERAARRRDNCSRARAQLAALESGQRMARVNDKGERAVLDDRARADEARRAREIIAADCV